jgi:PAS domain-containing protein
VDSAVQRLVARLAENSQKAQASAEQRMVARLAEISQPIAETATEARETLASVRSALDEEVGRARASLGEIEQAANRMSEYSAQLEAASQDTVNELHRRLEGVLTSQTSEVNRRTEALLSGAVERLGTLLETAGKESSARTVAEIEAKLAPQIERAQEALRQLATREEQAEETLRIHRERLRQASEQSQRETAATQAGIVAQLHNDFEMVRRDALVKWNEEIEANSVRAAHDVAEEMVKTAEWHQRKAQSDLQAVAVAALENSGRSLEKKTAEAAQKFAGELAEQRAQQAEQSREQLATVAGEVVIESQGRFQQVAEAAAKSFGQVLENVAGQARERFAATSRVALDERAAQLQAAAEKVREKLETEAERFHAEFQVWLAEDSKNSVAGAQQSFDAQMTARLESFRAQRDAEEQEWAAGLKRLSGESLSQYEERLRTAGDSWMLTSVKKLNEHGQSVIDSLSKQAEQSLRNTCSKVFDALAAAMRERLLGNSAAASSAAAAPLRGQDPPPPEKIFRP